MLFPAPSISFINSGIINAKNNDAKNIDAKNIDAKNNTFNWWGGMLSTLGWVVTDASWQFNY